jgi:hypothetical protein
MPSDKEPKEAGLCPLCLKIKRADLRATNARNIIATMRGGTNNEKFKQAQKAIDFANRLRKEHPHCSWCSLLMGPSHLAFECRWEVALICQFCHSEVSRGIIKWPRSEAIRGV